MSKTYYINVKPSNLKDFHQIIKSLKNLGLAREGPPIPIEDLISVLEHSRQEAKEGKTLTSKDVKKQVENWTKKQ